MNGAYYNEIDPFCVQWLRNLIAAGHIAPGEVDSRSIVDVRGDDLRGFTQCHFFAGIGVWSYALRLAGWNDERPVWTGSCPCQPFSAAGKGQADEDDRHLAPAWLRLIRECHPSVIFGEQVGAAVRVGWLDALFTEMESLHYACGAVDFPACSVGAPFIRQRIWFCAAYFDGKGLSQWHEPTVAKRQVEPYSWSEFKRVHAEGAWESREDKSRVRVFVDGATARVGRLRAYGNAIVAPQAAEFIRAFMECRP